MPFTRRTAPNRSWVGLAIPTALTTVLLGQSFHAQGGTTGVPSSPAPHQVQGTTAGLVSSNTGTALPGVDKLKKRLLNPPGSTPK